MKKNIFTRMTAVLLTVTAAAAQCAYVCGASALTKEELCVKYAAKTEIIRSLWLHEYGTELEDPFEYLKASKIVTIDASGMGDDGVFYGEEFANRKYLVKTPYLYEEWGNSHHRLYLGDCSYSDGFYYLEKQDGTAMILGADYDYMNEQKTETLIIPETIGGLTVTEIGEYAFQSLYSRVRSVKEIVVPSTVTKVRKGGFNKAVIEGKINLPENIEYLGEFSYAQVKNALGDVVVLPETLEYCSSDAFTDDIMQELILPESWVFNEYGCITYTVDGTQQGRKTLWFPNCVTADDEYFNQENLEGIRAAHFDDPSEHPELVYYPFGNGDSNCSGTTDVSDSVLLARYCAEDQEAVLTAEGKTNSDTTGDGALTMDDVTETLKIVAKLK